MRDEIVKTFLDQIFLEKEVEKVKTELANRGDFTCMTAFKLFDYRGLDSLTRTEFTEALFSFVGHNLFDRNQAWLIFDRYD